MPSLHGRLDPNSAEHWDRVYARERSEGKLRQDTGLLKHLALFAGRPRILDFGSGPGGNVLVLAPHLRQCTFTLVDHSRTALEEAQKQLRGRNDHEFIFARDLEGVSPGSQDLILTIEVLEHVREYASVLGRLWEVLAPGGLLMLSVPVKGWRDRHREHVNKFTITKMFQILSAYTDWVHLSPRSYSRRSGILSTAYFYITKPMLPSPSA
jgi:2-polyprenyl-3-methyl-5-hydroxy-6-metoxy-1,4-benzoquinol methylase